jgi:hypothetical protein
MYLVNGLVIMPIAGYVSVYEFDSYFRAALVW